MEKSGVGWEQPVVPVLFVQELMEHDIPLLVVIFIGQAQRHDRHKKLRCSPRLNLLAVINKKYVYYKMLIRLHKLIKSEAQ